MRVILTAVVLVAIARPAWASCDCCEFRQTLIGWSEDGRYVATIRATDESEQIVVQDHDRAGKVVRVLGEGEVCGLPHDRPLRVRARGARSAAQRVDVRDHPALRPYRLVAPEPAWREAYREGVRVRPGPARRFAGFGPDTPAPPAQCTSWTVTDADRRVLARLPRACDPQELLYDARVLGGYVHPGGKRALLKVRESLDRGVSVIRYVAVDL